MFYEQLSVVVEGRGRANVDGVFGSGIHFLSVPAPPNPRSAGCQFALLEEERQQRVEGVS